MIDIGWAELMVVAMLALIIIGPKDLPRVMRSVGQWVNKARGMSREFRSSINEMISEAELDDAKQAIQSTRQMSVDKIVEDTIDPGGTVKSAAKDINAAARADGTSGTTSTAKSTTEAAPKSADAGAEAKAETGAEPAGGDDQGGATVITTPLQKAPPHSIVSPAEPAASGSEAPAAAADKVSGQKSA